MKYVLSPEQMQDLLINALSVFNGAKVAIKYGAQKESMPKIREHAKVVVEILQAAEEE